MFKFALDQAVHIFASGEQGVVVARAEYVNSAPQYLIRYQRKDGCATEAWWPEDALL